MQFKAKMSSKEAVDLDGSKRTARAQKVWETRVMANQLKSAGQNTHKIRMSNAEIEVDKQRSSAKIKTVEVARQRSDLGIKKTPHQIKRTRSAMTATINSVRDDINLVKLRKLKSDSAANHSKSLPLQSVEGTTIPPTTKSDEDKAVVAESDKDLEINQVKAITNNADQNLTPFDVDCTDDNEEEEEEVEVELEKEMNEEVARRSVEIKDIIIPPQEQKPKKGVIEDKKKMLHSNDRSPPITPILKRVAPAANHARIHPTPAKIDPISDHEKGTSSRLQSLADLIMWKDVSKSAFIFGIGSFGIISTSYTKDLNISCISVISYLALVYLAVSFIFRSIISRGNVDTYEEYVVGEEEAVWLIKLVLPYVNEFLSKLRALFSGDPATTMKLAVVLFVLARCGSSITISKMTRLGFLGVFILPKLSSSYSSQLSAYGTFWIGRLKDGWESCSHKKAVAFGIFSLFWNVSSVVARIWVLFLLFVAFRHYQHKIRNPCNK